MNDRSELQYGLGLLRSVCDKRAKESAFFKEVSARTRGYEQINLFVSSFTDEGDLLSQWRGYAAGGGVSIEFSFSQLQEQVKKFGFFLEKCIYDRSEQELMVNKFIDGFNIIDNDQNCVESFLLRYVPLAMKFKQVSFSEEKEWRLMSSPTASHSPNLRVRPAAWGLVPYLVFDLATGKRPFLSDVQPWRDNEYIGITGVRVGPHPEQVLQMEAVGQLFDSNHVFVEAISRSTIPFRG